MHRILRYMHALFAVAVVLAAADAPGQQVRSVTPIADQDPFLSTPAPPTATLDGTISPITPGWDPYADPSAPPPALFPNNGTTPGGYPASQGGYVQADGTVYQPQRLWDKVWFDYYWLYSGNKNDFGVQKLELNTSFAFPIFLNPAPIKITPGFAVRYLDGPSSGDFPNLVDPSGGADLPSRVYDAYLETSWKPVFSSWFSGDLAARVGVYSDFEKVNSDSVRIIGHGAGVFTLNPQFRIVVGAAYLDRLNIKVLPVGGIIYTPNPDTRYEIVFPWPRVSFRWTTIGNTDIWWYVRGELGGGDWSIERLGGAVDEFTYNDLRAATGFELIGFRGLTTWIEAGYVWDRELIYRSATGTVRVDDTFMLRAGVKY